MKPDWSVSFTTENRPIFSHQILPAFFYKWVNPFDVNDASLDLLKKSIKKIGLINPILVIQNPKSTDEFILVSGFRRFNALIKLNKNEIKSAVIKENLSEFELFLIFLFENFSHKSFTPLEISEFLNYLSKNVSIKEIIFDFLPLFKIQPAREEFEKYLILSQLLETEKDAIRKNILDSKIARKFPRLEIEDRKTVLSLFEKIRPSVSYQDQILDLLEEIGARDKKKFDEVISSSEISDVINNPKVSPQQKSAKLKKFLEILRRPTFENKMKEFQKVIKSMKLDKDIQITPSEFFEASEYFVSAKFKDKSELEKIAKSLLNGADKFDFDI